MQSLEHLGEICDGFAIDTYLWGRERIVGLLAAELPKKPFESRWLRPVRTIRELHRVGLLLGNCLAEGAYDRAIADAVTYRSHRIREWISSLTLTVPSQGSLLYRRLVFTFQEQEALHTFTLSQRLWLSNKRHIFFPHSTIPHPSMHNTSPDVFPNTLGSTPSAAILYSFWRRIASAPRLICASSSLDKSNSQYATHHAMSVGHNAVFSGRRPFTFCLAVHDVY